MCQIRIKHKTNLKINAPSDDLVAMIMPSMKGLDTTIAVVDYSLTRWGNEWKEDQNNSFYFVLSMLFDKLKERLEKYGREFPTKLLMVKRGKLEEVEKNTFYPYLPR